MLLYDEIIFLLSFLPSKTEQKFEDLGRTVKSNVCECLQNIEKDISTYGEKLKTLFPAMKNDIGTKYFLTL